MHLTTEIFVMVIYIFCLPIVLLGFRSGKVPGATFFVLAYSFLVLSNIFTVVEAFWLESMFNFLEHSCLLISSGCALMAVLILTTGGPNSKKSSSSVGEKG